jgi:hypothetical protein
VRKSARRLEYVPKADAHPVNCINTPELCVTAMAFAFAWMDPRGALADATLIAIVTKRLNISPTEAMDMVTVAAWLMSMEGGVQPCFQRLTRRLKQLDHGPDFDRLMRVLGDVTAAGTKGMPSPAQSDALGALASVFRTA